MFAIVCTLGNTQISPLLNMLLLFGDDVQKRFQRSVEGAQQKREPVHDADELFYNAEEVII